MKRVLLLFCLYVLPANANIVPNFVQGNMSSTTNTQTVIREQVTSTDYYGNSYEYTVTGTGISTNKSIAPNTTNINTTVNGQSIKYTGLDLSKENKPIWTLVNPTSGNAFQFTETYRGPGGISNVTSITRDVTTESVTITTSVFSQ